MAMIIPAAPAQNDPANFKIAATAFFLAVSEAADAMQLTPLPSLPEEDDPDSFQSLADAFLAAMPGMATEMGVTALPTAPSSSDTSNFVDETEAFLAALSTFRNELNLAVNDADKTVTFHGHAEDTADATSHTFVAHAIGTPTPTRRVVVAALGVGPGVLGVTIGGVATTVLHSDSVSRVVIATVPDGATADILVIGAGTCTSYAIAVWSIQGLSSSTPFDSDSAGPASPDSVTVLTKLGGVAIAWAWNTSSSTVIWTGVTEDCDATVEGTAHHSGGCAATTGRKLTVTATFSGGAATNKMFVNTW